MWRQEKITGEQGARKAGGIFVFVSFLGGRESQVHAQLESGNTRKYTNYHTGATHCEGTKI